MEVAAITFGGDSYGKLKDLGSQNARRIASGKGVTLTIDPWLRAVHVVERRAEEVVNDYLAPFEALSMIELKREPGKAGVMPERGQSQQGQKR